MFDYPPEAEVKAEEVMEKIKTAVLSTTVQARRRKQAREAKERRETGMDLDQPLSKTNTEREVSTAPEETRTENGEKEGSESSVTKKKVEREKVGYEMENMSRVLPAQLKYISFPGERYVPVKKPTGGVILLHDTTPDVEKDLLELKVKKVVPGSGLDGEGANGESAADAAAAPNATDVVDPASVADDGDGSGLYLVNEDEEDAEVPADFAYESEGDRMEE